MSDDPSFCSNGEELINDEDDNRDENSPAVLLDDPTTLSVLLHEGNTPVSHEIPALTADEVCEEGWSEEDIWF